MARPGPYPAQDPVPGELRMRRQPSAMATAATGTVYGAGARTPADTSQTQSAACSEAMPTHRNGRRRGRAAAPRHRVPNSSRPRQADPGPDPGPGPGQGPGPGPDPDPTMVTMTPA